jgi:hypothetical protein
MSVREWEILTFSEQGIIPPMVLECFPDMDKIRIPKSRGMI